MTVRILIVRNVPYGQPLTDADEKILDVQIVSGVSEFAQIVDAKNAAGYRGWSYFETLNPV